MSLLSCFLDVSSLNLAALRRRLFLFCGGGARRRTAIRPKRAALHDFLQKRRHIPLGRGKLRAARKAAFIHVEPARDLHLDLTRSVLVGDRCSDIAAANTAGLAQAFLLRGTETGPCSGTHTAVDTLAPVEAWLTATHP